MGNINIQDIKKHLEEEEKINAMTEDEIRKIKKIVENIYNKVEQELKEEKINEDPLIIWFNNNYEKSIVKNNKLLIKDIYEDYINKEENAITKISMIKLLKLKGYEIKNGNQNKLYIYDIQRKRKN